MRRRDHCPKLRLWISRLSRVEYHSERMVFKLHMFQLKDCEAQEEDGVMVSLSNLQYILLLTLYFIYLFINDNFSVEVLTCFYNKWFSFGFETSFCFHRFS